MSGMRRVIPDPNVMGSPSFWRLRPSSRPTIFGCALGSCIDLLWVDAQGVLVPPVGNRHLPALRFFWDPQMMHASSNPFRQEPDAVAG